MTPELNNARAYLRTAQNILAHWRARPNAPRWLITYAEQRVLGALDWVWREQCRAVFDSKDEDFFDTQRCAEIVNQVDWNATGEMWCGGAAKINLKSAVFRIAGYRVAAKTEM